jgi:monofunctional biosynthetic peptidoglycan transglycosylase
MGRRGASNRTRSADSAAPARRRSPWRRIGRGLFLLCLLFVIASIVLVALYRVVPPPATPLMLIRAAQGYGLTKSWRSLDTISPYLVRAVIAGEDARFGHHHGFDFDAIERAWERYRRGRGRLVGASTISMQTAKNLFLWPGRDWLRKALEAWFTAWIELAWSKRRIIEVYLNIVEWDVGIYGAAAAARHYFGKSAAALSAREAARLAAVLPDPLDRSASRPGPAARRHAAFILEEMPLVPVERPLPCGGR